MTVPHIVEFAMSSEFLGVDLSAAGNFAEALVLCAGAADLL
jgi:hypothetical protein